ncbi:ATPase [Micromonospora sp. NPDC005710]|uniref:ATPase n=1 Tax=Micromonospora sp. NPDC005710 TaxID=3157051 RepID=UPI0033E0A9E0
MRFSVVETGYDKRQVDHCLDELGIRLSRLAARAEGAAGEWDEIRQEAASLSGLLRRLDLGDATTTRPTGDPERHEAAEILAQARLELDEAREEARRVRERAYAEAVQARRDVEAALDARRRRETRLDDILGQVTVDQVPVGQVPVDTPTAAAGVAGSRLGAGGLAPVTEPSPRGH